jgi:hypothetical protein
MKESDGSRRPSLTRWLSDKVEDLAGVRRTGATGPGRGPGPGSPQPDPRVAQQAAEIARLKREGEELKRDGGRLAKELDDVQVTLIGKEAEFKNELQDLQERNAELLDKIVKLTQRDRELQAKILDAKFEGTGAKDQAKKLDTDLRDLRRSHKAQEEQIAQMKTQVETLEKEAAGRPDPAQAAAEAEALTRRLQESLKQNKSLTEERDGLRSQRASGGDAPSHEAGKGETPEDGQSRARARDRGRMVTGPASDPLKAMAAGKRPAIARHMSEARQRQGDAAQKLLESGDRGFATLPEGFIEALLEHKQSGSSDEHRAARRGGSKRRTRSSQGRGQSGQGRGQSRSQGRGRSRRSGSGAGNR